MRNVLVRAIFGLAPFVASLGCEEAPPCPDKPAEITPEDEWLCTFANRKDGKVGIDQPCGGEDNVECCYGLTCMEGTCKVIEGGRRLGATCYSNADCLTPDLICDGGDDTCHEACEGDFCDPEWCLP